jgi:hypothetical protein
MGNVGHEGGSIRVRATAAVHSCQPAGFRRCDKGYDQKRFVREARERNITPHVTQNTSHRRSAIDGRTTRHPGCHVSQQCRKLVEQTFGGTRQLACWPSCAIADKATLTKNTVRVGDSAVHFEQYARPTPLQAHALDLLGVSYRP